MSVFDTFKNVPHRKLKTLAGLSGGTALLVLAALTLSGSLPGLPQAWKFALHNDKQVAAVYASAGVQTISVTPGDMLQVFAWGGGGIAGTGETLGSCDGYTVLTYGNGPGGGGGYTGGIVTVPAGITTLYIVVGAAGGGGAAGSNGSGGGYSGIFTGTPQTQANALMIAGGGGGSGAWVNITGPAGTCAFPKNGPYAPGGFGGGASGGNTTGGTTGGTQSAGGAGGAVGGALSGGAGVQYGGGGGAGYYGGGGGTSGAYTGGVGGGGGSGYCAPSTTNCVTVTASTQGIAANSGSALNGAGNSNTDGAVVISSVFLSFAPSPSSVSSGGTSNLTWSGTSITSNSCSILDPNGNTIFAADPASDQSPHGIVWTKHNLASTDFIYDTPTNNFATFNPLIVSTANPTFSSGNLTTTSQGTSTILMTSGKWYWEVKANAVGVIAGVTPDGVGSGATTAVANGTTVGFKFDADAGTLNATTNGSSYSLIGSGLTGGRYAWVSGASNSINFGQGVLASATNYDATAGGAFVYAVPSGFKALSSKNLSTPAIVKPSDYFNAIAYTGAPPTSGATWTVPSDWVASGSKIEVIGGGGGGNTAYPGGAAGGGGGAYAVKNNVSLTPGATVGIAVGSGGATDYPGGDTFLCNSISNCGSLTGSAVIVGAKGGGIGVNGVSGGVGGAASASIGNTRYNGGNGGADTSGYDGGGGGGAAGPFGAGHSSLVLANAGYGGIAGGGAGGGTDAVANNQVDNAGAGGNNHLATGGGAAGTSASPNGSAGTNGGGGGGIWYGVASALTGNVGGNGTEWDATHGAGGGAGGAAGYYYGGVGGQGGLYGGGGGGGGYNNYGAGGAGGQGIIAITYTPSGGSQQKIYLTALATNRVVSTNFQPDLVWIKNLGTTNWGVLSDSVRGALKSLFSNSTSAETTSDSNGFLASFLSYGFSVTSGSGSSANVNTTGNNYISWAWKESATDGFDIVSYSGNGTANRMINHSLGAAPNLVLVKSRDLVEDWFVYNSAFPSATSYQLLDSNGAVSTTNSPWGTGSFTSSQFMVSNNATNNTNQCDVSPQTIVLTSGTSWTVPSDWTNVNSIEVIGGGGGGGGVNTIANSGGGGGGGAYSKSINLTTLTPNSTVTYQIGVGGSGGSTAGGAGTAGTDTWFNASSMAACVTAGATVCAGAKAGNPGVGSVASHGNGAGGAGGLATGGVGSTKYNGGTGATGSSLNGGAGGGGAAGKNGAGNNGSSFSGGSGDAGTGGAGGGGNANGSAGTEWGTAGSGGGGGGGTGTSGMRAGSAGLYGAGGGSGGDKGGVAVAGAAGAQGVIVISYTPSSCTSHPYVAYVFKNVEGFSKFGSYVGNGSTNGPFIYTGFKPKYVMIKNNAAGYDWYTHDSTRDPINPAVNAQAVDTPTAQISSYPIDFLANGFKIRNVNGNWNANTSSTYSYAAFADVPLQQSGQVGSVNLGTSIHFNSAATQYLSNIPSVVGNTKTFTLSFWVKRGKLGTTQNLFTAGTSGSRFEIGFDTNDALTITGAGTNITTTALFRDTSSWVHVVVAVDTTQASQYQRVKIYENNNDISPTSGGGIPSQNQTQLVNTVVEQDIGRDTNNSAYFDGALADMYLIDGLQLTPSSFGAQTSNGVWEPSTYSGSYGTDGFHLSFAIGGDSGTVSTGPLTQTSTFTLQCSDLESGAAVTKTATVNVSSGNVAITATDSSGVPTSGGVTLATDKNTTIAWTSTGSIDAATCALKKYPVSNATSTIASSNFTSGDATNGTMVDGPFTSGYRSYSLWCKDLNGVDIPPAYVRIDVQDICSDIPGSQWPTAPASPCVTPGSTPGQCVPSGYTYTGGACTSSSSVTLNTFTAVASKVRKNTPTNVTFSWTGTGLPASCTITGTGVNVTGASPQTASVNISTPTIYTLTCGAATRTAIVGLLPTFQEI